MSINNVRYVTKIRKDKALRVPDDIWNLGFTDGKTVQVSLRILESEELPECLSKKE